jgi:hypothetical protein
MLPAGIVFAVFAELNWKLALSTQRRCETEAIAHGVAQGCGQVGKGGKEQ